jgi:hypothetical protein
MFFALCPINCKELNSMNALLHRKSPSVEIRNLSSEAELDYRRYFERLLFCPFPDGNVAAVAQVTFVLVGWALVYRLTYNDDAAAPESTLKLLLLALEAGAVALLASLLYLFQIFKGQEQR